MFALRAPYERVIWLAERTVNLFPSTPSRYSKGRSCSATYS